ncbi:MAG: T9SS type A sorting domain-containing protein [Candidatus Cloacimonetes bacterium]|nr:T9SS type A sorting domain-containing protein [Candidatus Cloacimonadota bacterium]
MKKIALITIIFALLCFSLALANKNDFQQPSGKEIIPAEITYNIDNLIPVYNLGRNNTPVPDYEFLQFPTTIMTSYYDYMPGSYNSHPLRIQTDWGDGTYIAFFGRPSTTLDRRQYWAYLDSYFDLVDWGTITTYDRWQGYGGIAIHPATGNCVAGWHENVDPAPDDILETTITYDDFDLIEIPGFWATPTIIPQDGTNEYIWPRLEIGPSPLGDDYVRIYHLANNSAYVPGTTLPVEDTRIMYIDIENYNGMDMTPILELANWSEVYVFTDWRPKHCRPFQTFGIDYNNPGRVAFFGDAAWLSGDMGDMPVDEGLFVWESYDYGETWDYANLHSDGPASHIYIVDNVPGFVDNNGVIVDSIEVGVCGNHYTAIYDSEGNLHMPVLLWYILYHPDPEHVVIYEYGFPQAEAVWNGHEFSFHEVPEMPGIDPLSGHSVPWEIDPVTGDTLLYETITWSLYPGEAGRFHHNTQKQAINLENNWMLQMWVDGTYHQLALDGVPGYAAYLEHPIIYISVSSDNGRTWSEPIELTDIYYPEYDFSDEITVFPYVCDQIVDLGDDWGQVYMYYMDDNSFGSYAGSEPSGENNGGQINYSCLKIKFPTPGSIQGLVTLVGGSGNVQDVKISFTTPLNNTPVYPDDIGNYEMPIAAGLYNVTASLDGYTSHTVNGVRVHAGSAINVNFTLTSHSADDHISDISTTKLNQNYPNPFSSTTSISYYLPKSDNMKLQIYNARGQLVETLVDNYETVGNHSIIWDVKNLSSGIYFYKLEIGNTSITKKMLLVR